MTPKIIATTLFFSLLMNITSSFASHEASQSRLHTINNKIAAIQSNISHDKHQLSQIQIKLKHVEIASAVVSKNLHSLTQRIAAANHSISLLKTKQAQIQQKLDTQLGLLNTQLSNNYELWREPYFKLVLNPNVEKIGRMLIYYRYLNQARGDLVGNIKTLQEEVQSNIETQQHQYQSLVSLQEKKVHEKKALENVGKQRQEIMSKISAGINDKSAKLRQLIRNKERLEAMINALQKESTQASEGFSKKRGGLNLPTQGIITARYGTQIEQSELRWTGVLIKAQENSPVYAIAGGKVVFAKWMEGYGLLMIIDHGGGYMSLYGRNHYLYKKTGDRVRAGEEIAAVGNSGGFEQPALYFGLRHNGQAVNPLTWCTPKKRAAFSA